ncbi:hypothetical protein Sjap_023302 [Stephania japonica]|uniref:DYW domain-containing protein n=1 Tax=Stephania japonica TaxID=461633 RepID=A0AAP0EDH6_9MAGN
MACSALPSPPIHQQLNPPPPTPTHPQLLTLLKSPKTPTQLKTLHAHLIKTSLTHNHLFQGQLLLCCNLSNSPAYARRVFDTVPNPTQFFYNAMIKCYSENDHHKEAIELYGQMRSCSVNCDSFTFPVVLRSVGSLRWRGIGEEVHGYVVKMGFGGLVIANTALIDMYCCCGMWSVGRQVFDRIGERVKDVICWNTMIAGYVKNGNFLSAKELFDEMPERNVSSWNTVVDMYGKCGDVGMARRLFDEMPARDVISWNAMISGYVHGGRFSDALELFRMMQGSDVKPNEVTVVAVLPACGHLGALDLGQWIHSYIKRNRVKMDVYVDTALIDMYGKCGSVEDARGVFDNAEMKDTFLCSTMIEVLAMHGKAEEAFGVFNYMRRTGIRPSNITFVGLLKACSHVGLVDIGVEYFGMMSKDFELVPKVEHYGCLVDLLGRAGHLEKAYETIKSMPMEPHPIVWGTLLSACRIHCNVKLAEEVALHLIELEPQNCGHYVLLSNIYSKAGKWNEAAKLRKIMKEKGVMKKPGCSSIEVDHSVYEFFAGDCIHPRRKEIYEMLDKIITRLKSEGYSPKTSSALHDVDIDEKEQALLYHSEKLAAAFGLLNSNHKTPIRIVKNLRICDDCHVFMKMVSKYFGRSLIIRDCNRFHHFKDGSCSCCDYW